MNKNQLIANLEKAFHCLLNAKNGNPSKIKGKWITEEHSKEEILKVLDRWEISIKKKLTNEIGQQQYKQNARTEKILKEHSPEDLRDYLTLRAKLIFYETKADVLDLKKANEKSFAGAPSTMGGGTLAKDLILFNPLSNPLVQTGRRNDKRLILNN